MGGELRMVALVHASEAVDRAAGHGCGVGWAGGVRIAAIVGRESDDVVAFAFGNGQAPFAACGLRRKPGDIGQKLSSVVRLSRFLQRCVVGWSVRRIEGIAL